LKSKPPPNNVSFCTFLPDL